MTIGTDKAVQVFHKYNGHCAYCGCSLHFNDMVMDSFIPEETLRESGREEEIEDLKNLMPACKTCAEMKKGKTVAAFKRDIFILLTKYGENVGAIKFKAISKEDEPPELYYELYRSSPQEFAKLLDGREYGSEMDERLRKSAKSAGLVIVYGYSDDNMEFDGAVYDEIGCFDGGMAYLDPNACRIVEKEELESKKGNGANRVLPIEAVWCGATVRDKNGCVQKVPWSYQTPIPHAEFMIYEDKEPFCMGIVFSLNDARAYLVREREKKYAEMVIENE